MFLLLFLYGNLLFCQNSERVGADTKITHYLDYLYSQEDISGIESEELYSELTDYLTTLLLNPINLNGAGKGSLERLLLFTPFEIASFINYREEYGQILSISELYLIPGLSHQKISLLEPFVTISHTSKSLRELFPGNSQILLRGSRSIQTKKGYSPISRAEYEKNPGSRYLGNPLLLYGQYRYSVSDMANLIFTMEKDPGERGADYISWSIMIRGSRFIDRIVAGSYGASFGQGLVLSNSFPAMTSWEPYRLIIREREISPYGSTDENLAFRGAAITSIYGAVTLTLLLSRRALDARVTEEGYTSLLKTGLHNTPLTLERKGALKSQMGAVNLSLSLMKFKTGITICTESKSVPYAGRDSSLIIERDRGKRGSLNISADWRYISGKSLFTGEAAINGSGYCAFFAALLIRGGGGRGEFALTTRYSDKYFTAPLSNLPALKGDSELGFKSSYRYKWSEMISLSVNSEYSGNYFRLGVRGVYSTERELFEIRGDLQSGRAALRGEVRLWRDRRVALNIRGDFTVAEVNNGRRFGYHLYQEILTGSSSTKVEFSARLSWFSAPVWANRIYTYERDMLYQFRTTTLYGKGVRYYLNVKAKLIANMELWLKISSFTYFDRDKTGEGPEEIHGPSRGEVKLQLRYRF